MSREQEVVSRSRSDNEFRSILPTESTVSSSIDRGSGLDVTNSAKCRPLSGPYEQSPWTWAEGGTNDTGESHVPSPRHMDFSRKLKHEEYCGVLSEISSTVLKELESLDRFKGVAYGLRVYSWESLDDDNLQMIRIELRVPGVAGISHKNIWSEFSQIVYGSLAAYAESSSMSDHEARLLRRMRAKLSVGVVPV